MRISSKGQVTIPAAIRKAAGLSPQTEVEIGFDGDVITIVKSARSKGAALVKHLKGRRHLPMTTDEIMALTRGEGGC